MIAPAGLTKPRQISNYFGVPGTDMADRQHLAALRDPKIFKAVFGGTNAVRGDFSGAHVSFDFSGLAVKSDFSDAILNGSTFNNCILDSCNFGGADWAGCDFFNATFSGGSLANVKNAHKAKNLHTVDANGRPMKFETVARPWWNMIDWELLGVMGRLPLFTASTATLILLPLYFYLLDIYNQHLLAWKNALTVLAAKSELAGQATNSEFVEILSKALARLDPLPIPNSSLETLISAMLLLVGSVLYWRCPPRVKQFSHVEWCDQMGQPMLTYWPVAWRYSITRMVCALTYGIGGALALWIIGNKLYATLVYILRNSN